MQTTKRLSLEVILLKANRNKLDAAMARACMTRKELAAASGMPTHSLDNVLRGRTVRPATLGKVARALGVDVEELMEVVKE